MAYDKALVAAKLRRWEKYLLGFRLPAWEELPNFGLYMDQVTAFLMEKLDYMPPELKEEQIVTAAAINNYVRGGVMPAPVKKKYYRVHLAYLVMICTLKQSLNIAVLRRLLPQGEEEADVRPVYEAYAQRHNLCAGYFVEQVRMGAAAILDHAETGEMTAEKTEDLIASTAILAGFSRLLSEKLLLLEGKTEP